MMEWKWPGLVLAFGVLIMVYEWNAAGKKKEGVTVTDRRRIFGIAWIAVVMAGLAWFVERVA